MQIVTVPYELLVRWNEAGALSGASLTSRTVYSDNGAVLFDKIGDPVPVGVAGQAGLPAADVLGPDNFDAVVAVNLIAAERDALAAQLAAVTAERDALAAQLADMAAERDAPAAP